MKQFTSHIGFSLTKKRFKMMLKHYSPFRSYSKKMLLIPFFVITALTFCTKSEHSNGFSFYTDTELSANVVNDGGVFGGPVLRYEGTDGNYYSGTRDHYHKDSNELAFSDKFEDGYRVTRINYDDGVEISFRYEFEYDDSNLVSRRKFNESDVLVEEWTAPINRKPGSIKEWHPNEQLKFEVHYLGDLEYEGLMTLYDEEGEIIEQERYKDGQLISDSGDTMLNTQLDLVAPSDTLSDEEQTMLDETVKVYRQKYQTYMDLDPETTSLEDLRTAFKKVDEAILQMNQVLREIYGEDVVLPPIKLGPTPETRKNNN